MKNASMWVMVGVLLLVGTAIFYEMQYRQANKSESVTPVRHASSSRKAPDQPQPPAHLKPTTDGGRLIG